MLMSDMQHGTILIDKRCDHSLDVYTTPDAGEEASVEAFKKSMYDDILDIGLRVYALDAVGRFSAREKRPRFSIGRLISYPRTDPPPQGSKANREKARRQQECLMRDRCPSLAAPPARAAIAAGDPPAGAPLPDSGAFTLLCEGTTTTANGYGSIRREPYSYRYRIDLDKRQWCDGDCKFLRPIHKADRKAIVLSPPERRRGLWSGLNISNETIDRATGRHTTRHRSGKPNSRLVIRSDGECEAGQFSGFPANAQSLPPP